MSENLRQWYVTIPFAGQASVSVCASSQKEAVDAAFEALGDALRFEPHPEVLHFVWDFYSKLHTGNVCHVGTAWEIEVEEE